MWRVLVVALCAACSKQVDLEQSKRAWVQELQAAVDDTIKEPDRGERVKVALVAAEQAVDEFYRSLAQIRADLHEISKNYDATEAQFLQVHGRLHLLRTTTRERLIGLAMQARKDVTKEEWEKITGAILKELG